VSPNSAGTWEQHPTDREVIRPYLHALDVAHRAGKRRDFASGARAALDQGFDFVMASSDAETLALTFEALVVVTMRDAGRKPVESFEQAVATIPKRPAGPTAVRRSRSPPASRLPNLRAFQKLHDDRISTLPGVQRLSSTLVMKASSKTGHCPGDYPDNESIILSQMRNTS
jgi:hypothetical protein